MKKKKIWQFKDSDNKRLLELEKMGLNPIISRVLANRGICGSSGYREFFNSGYENLSDPLQIKGIKEGAERLYKAVTEGEKVLVYGDYDVDGITAAVLLTDVLSRIGGSAVYYIPDRFTEGYGLNCQAIKEAGEKGIDLIVTVDCGITSVEEVKYANKLGMQVIITDHHEVPAVLPSAVSIIDPKLEGEVFLWSNLAGVGVAFKLAQAVTAMFAKEHICQEYLDIVALGTIADIVPLLGENRILVKEGLLRLSKTERLGLRNLLINAGLWGKEITAGQVGYSLAPRLNASGRLSRAETGVELLLCENQRKAEELAAYLDQENRKRQELEQDIFQKALALIEEKELSQDKIIVISSTDWHSGIIGIAASRICEKYFRPTIMIAIDEQGRGKGSARSIPGFDIYKAIASAAELLVKFGGHEMAAGLTLEEDKIGNFRKAINTYAEQVLSDKDLVPVLKIDAELSYGDITKDLVEAINKLAPFGNGNPTPVFVLRNQEIADSKPVGVDKKHLKLRLKNDSAGYLDGIAFRMGNICNCLHDWGRCSIAFYPEINNYNGQSRLQLIIKDIKPSHEQDDPFKQMSFLDLLFFEGEIWLEDDYYRDIINREQFMTKVVGVTFENRQDIIAGIEAGNSVALAREKDNKHDPWAVAVFHLGRKIGYLNACLARNIARVMDKGYSYEAFVVQITGRDKEIRGVNLCIRKDDPETDEGTVEIQRRKMKLLSSDILEQEIRKALLGEYNYHTKQLEALKYLQEDQNTLVIFGTGRGKSAVFQSRAAYLALMENKITVIVYPLRSLVNDQHHSLRKKLAPLGIRIAALNGSLNTLEKNEYFKMLLQGSLDIILTTPEFLEFHRDKFKAVSSKIGFFVVDEAHHLNQKQRKGYRLLGKNWRYLGKPQALAVTATADKNVAQEIVDLLECTKVVVDEHVRSNLRLIDNRGTKEKSDYLLKLIALGQRVVIYVNSRKQAYQLALDLRRFFPACKDEIAFYHGGLNREDRMSLENLFREGTLRVMVTTSAFGEGIDIPDIQHVVLYHLCFSRTEFNQLAGRAGRNNEEALVHIVFGEHDMKINEMILEGSAPGREMLKEVYIFLRQQAAVSNPLQVTNREIAEALQKKGAKSFREQSVSACLAILEDLGLLLREVTGSKRHIHLVPPPPGKLELTDSVRYLEGRGEEEEFRTFASFILQAAAEEILDTMNRPIYPES